jgi:asparagine synthase (glutamine-hydrolysing)
MCGIAGALGAPIDASRVDDALRVMGRRGPDATGVLCRTLGNHVATLLHTRLAIIDLDPRSSQPFERDGLAVTFNGEIYNYLEVRRELEEKGASFTTQSDTEVLLEAYRVWGDSCFDRLEGMWAFALLDTERKTVVLSRDRFGEKPLYTSFVNGTLYFASEIKALAAMTGEWPAVDFAHVARYLVQGYRVLHRNATGFYYDITEFPAGSFAELREPENVAARRYWSLTYSPRAMTAAEAVEGVRDRLIRSVDLRMRADVPLAFCLSGGIDSNALVGAAVKGCGREIHAFSIYENDPRYDERKNISASVEAFGCRHHSFTPTRANFLQRLEQQTAYHDAPVATISYYMHDFLLEVIAAEGFKVAVSGTAADELFTGYYDHYLFWLATQRQRPDFAELVDDWRRGYGQYVRNPLLQDPLRLARDPGNRDHMFLKSETFQSLMREQTDINFIEKTYANDPLRNRMMNELFGEVIPVILKEDDLDSMRWSVENRSPYLDRDLVEFAYSIPNEHLVLDGMAKWPLREAVAGLVPDSVRLDRQKRGFNGSILSLLDTSDRATRERLFAPGPIFDVVDRDAFINYVDAADLSDNAASKFMFSFCTARFFLDQHG